MLRSLFSAIFGFLHRIRLLLVALLVIGLPVSLYLTFSDEPVFGPEEDVVLGRQTATSIAADPEEYPLLSKEEYPEAYQHLQRIVGRVVSSDAVGYRDLFAYDDVRIIHDDTVLNAFCTPGGFVYVYSGLIRYLDSEDDLAGVLGHEIAHAEMRHSSVRIQREFGAQRLLDLFILGSAATVGDVVAAGIVKQLAGARYSRSQEAESDSLSVHYLNGSGYRCDGAASFFVKLLGEGDDVAVPEWASDHPDSQRRVESIRRVAELAQCSTAPSPSDQWPAFQAALPPVADPAPALDSEAASAPGESRGEESLR
jgi:predicted Zn-dependent protease